MARFIKGLKAIVDSSKFACGGSLQGFTPVKLNYLLNNGQWADVNFPGFQTSEMQQSIQASSVASFGKGKEKVTDKAYRDAYALDPSKFLTSFQLSNSGILGEICSFLAPDAVDVRAELYKLNIYTGPTGCFKSHVDTPRGYDMFGSLVVCLPSQLSSYQTWRSASMLRLVLLS